MFLRAEPYQLFCALVILPVVGWILVDASPRLQSSDSSALENELLAAVFAIQLAGFLAWFWSVATFCSSITNPEIRMDRMFLRLAVIYPPIYGAWFCLVVFRSNPPIGVIVVLHLFCMFCLFYDLYFASKSLALAELGRRVTFYDFAGPFFLLWFYPIGIWIVQPRIKRLFAERTGALLLPEDARYDA